ncbi:nucleoside hydrolase [Pelagibacterium halotolerans]|uniref:Inosine-uridine preferring nucleoside hydrolase n=1 Tax=Pelagibacterium halotolerans (strain DSM 22347 / JCM 15775 / CGMCC 1.7692 / B2) TaxID=1082931 RepID=G4REL3_PELHB|nr:nucleoside hydrolase [Pelagibacterium halotolerans]AEQ50863.1 inosine-uridine preferring nucleoside hydrolase [Pelagibacterium halotolerans B2]QJR19227.1 nucleoside hydrolase [Pelagibacterium halotolerans]SDZ98291.1 purine nucleosidase/pyrimidine-specific ribonucleoside hydrolase [Pelagibacterium halotolerans]
MKKILIDTDPGMDDTLAIVLAIKSPAVDVMGISTVAGNYPIEVTTANALKTLELLDSREIPVARGMGKPLARPLPKDPFSHGSDGQAEIHLPAPGLEPVGSHGVDLIIDTVKANPGEVTIVTLGPFTNLAMAIMKAPEIVPMIAEVVSIAGSFGLNKYAFANATGDTPQSEWNVYVDPEAAQQVFASGVKLRAVGLDVATHFDINFSEEQLAALKSSDRAEAHAAEKMVRFVQGRGFESYCVLIDSMAVAAVIDPTLIGTVKARVGVETKGELTLGQTVADFRHHHGWMHLPEIDVANSADYSRFLDLIMKTMLE